MKLSRPKEKTRSFANSKTPEKGRGSQKFGYADNSESRPERHNSEMYNVRFKRKDLR